MDGGFVLVHGFWHNHRAWDDILPLLSAAGFEVSSLDLPGAGVHAQAPDAYRESPPDPARFAAAPSPNAQVTQQERTEAVIEAVREQNELTGGRAVLVGHSMGGATVSAVAEAIPEELAAVVFVTAFMLPPGMPPIAMITHDLMQEALPPTLFAADPREVGALRINPLSDDPDYLALLREAFYGDLTDRQFAEALANLHPDEPAQVVTEPSGVTAERFGTLPRHYVECSGDRAITPAGQGEMVRLVDAAMGNATTVHRLDASHSPFHSQPGALAEILLMVRGQVS